MVLDEIFKFQKLSEGFIEELIKDSISINWNIISIHQELSEEFIHEYRVLLNWDHISQYQKLSEKFIEEHKGRVRWYIVLIYQDLSVEFKVKYKEFFNNIIKELQERLSRLQNVTY